MLLAQLRERPPAMLSAMAPVEPDDDRTGTEKVTKADGFAGRGRQTEVWCDRTGPEPIDGRHIPYSSGAPSGVRSIKGRAHRGTTG
jgi:hypothetical protein